MIAAQPVQFWSVFQLAWGLRRKKKINTQPQGMKRNVVFYIVTQYVM